MLNDVQQWRRNLTCKELTRDSPERTRGVPVQPVARSATRRWGFRAQIRRTVEAQEPNVRASWQQFERVFFREAEGGTQVRDTGPQRTSGGLRVVGGFFQSPPQRRHGKLLRLSGSSAA